MEGEREHEAHLDSPVRNRLWALVALAVAGGLIYGYNVSAAPYLDPIKDEFKLSTFTTELVSGGASLGAMLSMPFSGILTDNLGRRRTILVGVLPTVLGTCGLSFAQSAFQAVLARVVLGAGNAVAIHAVPIFLSEAARVQHRALLVALFQFFVGVGLTIQPLVQMWSGEWRVVAGVGCLPAVASGVLAACVLRRSRAWRRQSDASNPAPTPGGAAAGAGASASASADARASTTTSSATRSGIHARGGRAVLATTTPPGLEKVSLLESGTVAGRRSSFNVSNSASASALRGREGASLRSGCSCCRLSVFDPLRAEPDMKMLLAVGIVLAWTNNSTDIFLFYGVQVLQNAGFGSASSLQLLAILSAWTAVMVFPAVGLVNRLRRRLLFLGSFALVVVSFAGQAVAFAPGISSAVSQPMVVGWMLVFILAFQCGPGSMFLVLLSEVFPPTCRGVAVSIATFFMSAFSVLLNGTLLSTVAGIGSSATFAFYGILYAMCWVFLWKHLPETSKVDLSVSGHHGSHKPIPSADPVAPDATLTPVVCPPI